MGHKYPVSTDILSFEAEKELIIPEDLKEYFLTKNAINGNYNENMYCFYPFRQFQSIYTELKNWNGITDYSNIVNTLDNYKDCFVFADYMFHMFVSAIRLYKEITDKNEVYVLCGDKYRVIAESFSDFMQLYTAQSLELHFNS
jgi:hypothetical protein